METSLAEGVWLEDRSARLQWGLSLADLMRQTSPTCCTPCDRDGVQILVWDTRVFGGMTCQITTKFGGTRRPQSILRGIRSVFWPPKSIRTCPDAFGWLQEQLTQRFGLPMSITDNGEQGAAQWSIGNITLRHEYFNGMGGDHCTFIFLPQTDAEQVG